VRRDVSRGRGAVGSTLVWLVLYGVYGGVLVLVDVARRLRPVRSSSARCRRLILTGTFYHERWFRSHLTPLSRSGIEEIIVVCDEPRTALAKVRYCCPPRWVSRVFGRAAAKAAWMIAAGVKHPADLFMGYHFFPGALTALVAAGLCGGRSCYQSTGGPIEVLGGGFGNENPFMSRLASSSAVLESLAMRLIRRFDCVVVRGGIARRFFADTRASVHVAVIPGSVNGDGTDAIDERTLDMVFVGRLTEIKQPLQFVEIVAKVKAARPTVRAAVVGDGPLLSSARQLADRLGVSDCIEFMGRRDDVDAIVARAKVFVLTSRSEGLSIALAEAMSRGLPAVVANVGELSALVEDDRTGWLIEPNDIDAYAQRIVGLLDDEARWSAFSQAARRAARDLTGVDNVARRWDACFERLQGS